MTLYGNTRLYTIRYARKIRISRNIDHLIMLSIKLVYTYYQYQQCIDRDTMSMSMFISYLEEI